MTIKDIKTTHQGSSAFGSESFLLSLCCPEDFVIHLAPFQHAVLELHLTSLHQKPLLKCFQATLFSGSVCGGGGSSVTVLLKVGGFIENTAEYLFDLLENMFGSCSAD